MISKINNHSKNKLLIYFLIYLTFIASFVFGENSSGGSHRDFLAMQMYLDQISINFKQGIALFFEEGQGHSPVFYIIKSGLENVFTKTASDVLILTLGFSIAFVFYSILKKQFIGCNKNLLFLISLTLYLSPYIRSSAAWATNDNLGILFFALSISKFLTYRKSQNKNLKSIFLCFFFIVMASYIRQYYVIITLAYCMFLYKNISIKYFFYLGIFSFLISIPGLIYTYYFFISNFDYAAKGFTSPDIIFNLLIFFNLYLFYIFPFFFQFETLNTFKNFYDDKKLYIMVTVIVFIIIYLFYNLPIVQFGGGINYKIYQFLESELFFIFSSFMGVLLILLTVNLNFKNLLTLTLFFFMFPFSIIYQKYYDPIMIIMFFGFIQSDLMRNKIKLNKSNMIFVFAYFLIFLIGSNIYYLNI